MHDTDKRGEEGGVRRGEEGGVRRGEEGGVRRVEEGGVLRGAENGGEGGGVVPVQVADANGNNLHSSRFGHLERSFLKTKKTHT